MNTPTVLNRCRFLQRASAGLAGATFSILLMLTLSAQMGSAQVADVVTNGYSNPLFLGTAPQANFNSPSYSNLLLGVDLSWAENGRGIVSGSSIGFPDRAGIFWADGSYIYGWNNHDGDGVNRNELIVQGNHKLSMQCYDAGGNGGFQMGGSGPYHDSFWFQYDTDGINPALGFSKLVKFVTISAGAAGTTYAYSAIRAFAADTNSGMNTLRFYSGDPSPIDSSGATLVGTMLTNGWDFRGHIVTEHTTVAEGVTSYVLDWQSASSLSILAGGSSLALTTTNLPPGTTNNEPRTVFIKSGSFSPTLKFPSGWAWVSEHGPRLPPRRLGKHRVLVLNLTAIGPGDTNVFASFRTGVFAP